VEERRDRALRETEQLARGIVLYHGLFQHTGTGVAIYEAREDGEDFLFLDINPAGEKLSRVTKDEIVGRSILGIFPGVRDMGLFGVLQQVWRTGVPQTLPFREYRDNRISQWVENHVFKLPSGELVAIYEDITARKQVEEALKENLCLVETLMDAIPTPIYYKDVEGVYLGCNRAFAEASGRPKEEIVGRTVFDLAPKPLAEKYREMDEELLRQGGIQTYEYPVQFADGTRHDMVFRKAVFPRTDGTPAGLVGVMLDVSVLKEAEESIRRSEKKFSSAFHLNPNPMAITDMETAQVVDVNEAFLEWTGYLREEVLGHSTNDLDLWVHPEDRRQAVHDLRAHSEIVNRDALIRMKSRDIRQVLFSARFIELEGRNCFLSIVVDVTELRRVDEELRRSEERYRSLIETTRDLIYTTDRKGFITYANPTLARTLGYADHELKGRSFADILAPEYADFARDVFRRAMRGGSIPIYEAEMVRKDGTRLSVEFNTETILDADGGPAGRLGIGRDVTERRQAEQALRDSEEELAAIYENAPLIMMLIDEAWTVHKANAFASQLTGKSPGDLTALKCGEALCCLHALDIPEGCGHGPSCQDCALRLMALETIETGRGCNQKEVSMLLSDRGKEREATFLVSTRRVAVKGKHLAMVSIQDISERKQIERALQESEARYRSVVSTVGEGIIVQEASGKIVAWNRYAEDFFGLKAEEVLGRTSVDYPWATIHEDGTDYPGDMHPSMITLRTGRACDNRIMGIRRTDGHINWVSINTRPLFGEDGSKPSAVVISFSDITEKRRAENALTESEEKYRSLVDHSTDAILLTKPDGSILDANPAACEMFGRSREDILNIGRRGLVDITDPRLQTALSERAHRGGGTAEITMVRATGDKFPVEITSTIFLDANGEQKTSMIIRDISERRRAEEALRERDDRFRKLSSHVPGMIYQFLRRPDGTYCVPFTTEAIEDIFGCSPEDVREDFSPIARVILPEDLDKVIGSIESSAERLTPWRCEYRVQVPGRPTRWMFGQSTPEKLADGSIIWYGFNTDITDRKQAEELIRASSEEREWILKSMMNAFVIFKSVFDENGQFKSYRFQYINDAYERITGVTMEEVHGKTVHEVWPGTEPSWIENYGAVAVTGIPRTFEMYHQPTDKFYYCHVFRPWNTAERFCVIFEDITDRRRATDELVRSHKQMRALAGRLRDVREEERKRIARAIHDEMGQALTGIKMDLTWVQRQLADRPEIDRKQIAARFEAMGNLADVTIREMRRIITELRPGVLDDLGLVAAVEWLVQDFWNRTGTECRFAPPEEEIDVEPEKAIVIFRIAQEALTNIIRHAGATRVSVVLRVSDGSLALDVADNGRGFSEEDSRRTRAFGLLGMQERALAIRGTVDIESVPGEGTAVHLRVPLSSTDG